MFNLFSFLAWLCVLVSIVLALFFAPWIFSTLFGVLVFSLFFAVSVAWAFIVTTESWNDKTKPRQNPWTNPKGKTVLHFIGISNPWHRRLGKPVFGFSLYKNRWNHKAFAYRPTNPDLSGRKGTSEGTSIMGLAIFLLGILIIAGLLASIIEHLNKWTQRKAAPCGPFLGVFTPKRKPLNNGVNHGYSIKHFVI